MSSSDYQDGNPGPVSREPMPSTATSRGSDIQRSKTADRNAKSGVPSSARKSAFTSLTGAPVAPPVPHQPSAVTEEEIVPQKHKVESQRIVRGAHPEFNEKFEYSINKIKTSRYNVITFLPLNLYEQFHRIANIYFLVLVILQCIPLISPINPATTIMPFVGVLGLSAIKDLADDIQRHRSDNEINDRNAHLVMPGGRKLLNTPWSRLRVGQVIQIKSNEAVPADCLILSTSDDNGLCFVETLELDGETNLKVRQALVDTQKLQDQREKLALFDGLIKCEPPNNQLNKFEGRLDWLGNKYPLNNDNIALRGCTLRNTLWVFGLIIFAGQDTKLMKNSGKTKMKRTRIDVLANKLILCILGLLAMLLVVAAVMSFFYEDDYGRYFVQSFYTYWLDQYQSSPTVISLFAILSYLILIQTLIPISLYVTMEFIRLFLSRVCISDDLAMYYEPLDVAAVARTTTLNEELGQIEYIFSDKTGTLTQNIMTFNKCSIRGKMYGDPRDKSGRVVALTDSNKNMFRIDFSEHEPTYYTPQFEFFDKTLLDEVQKGNQDVHEFWKLLALCHTVIAEYDEYDGLVYKAQSPDEAALVAAARNFGFAYLRRSPETITISVLGTEVTYNLIVVLDFDNIRKRMSVIVEKDGRRTLYCKGADTLVLELLDRKSRDLAEKTKSQLHEYAGTGLRTLCLAAKDIDDDEWTVWYQNYQEASTALSRRDEKLARCYEEIESNLTLLGATAIEDKLQDGVPEVIYNLSKAGIKLWVLTGDKQETAINIGYSCNMLTETMEEFVIDAENPLAVKQQLIATRQQMDKIETQLSQGTYFTQQSLSQGMTQLPPLNGKMPSPLATTALKRPEPLPMLAHFDGFALIINGHSLVHALHPKFEQLFLSVAVPCKAVICCRVTPLQKAMVVDLVKRSKKTVTLAIGDGANDVNMIKTAHIGVGISGQEGMQAVLASDYSFGQFRFLQRLLMVHGRWSYIRIAIFLRYFFYKNFAFTLCHFWFGMYCGWSAQSVYDQWLIMCYNLIYTATPIIMFGWFEQDVNAYYSQTYPQLYQPGLRNAFFNLPLFVLSCLEGVYSSAVTFYIMRFGFGDVTEFETGSDFLASHAAFGVAVGTTIIFVVTIRCCLEMSYWTPFNFISVMILSLGATFVVQIAIAEILKALEFDFEYFCVMYAVWRSPPFWLCFSVSVVACSIPVVTVRAFSQTVSTNLMYRVRTRQRIERKEPESYDIFNIKRTQSTARRSRLGSGYAFAQQPGLGDMIQSGMLRESARNRGATGGRRAVTGNKSARLQNPYANVLAPPPADSEPRNNNMQYYGNAAFDGGDDVDEQRNQVTSVPGIKPRPKRIPQQQYRMTFF